MELVVLAFYPPPLVDVGDWALLMFFRLYLGLRVLRDYNEMYANRADLSRSQQNLQLTQFGWYAAQFGAIPRNSAQLSDAPSVHSGTSR